METENGLPFGLQYTAIYLGSSMQTLELTLAYGEFPILMKDDCSNTWWFLE